VLTRRLGKRRRHEAAYLFTLAVLVAAALVVSSASPPAASAAILPPTTIDGPGPEILDFGGVAMAADGSGGLVYVKTVEGIPHVFAARYVGGSWSEPIRVDAAGRFEASQPRIAAGSGGELIVTWVSPIATVGGKVRRALYSARLAPGARQFGATLLVDANLGEARGVSPSLATGAPGSAYVAYEVTTEEFTPGSPPVSGAVQLRPGDVVAEVRLAHLAGGRWSRLGAMNRNSAASMRPPGVANAPQVVAVATGNAVVAWQEPDSSGAARIWERRIFGTTVGPPSQVSPSAWEGKPIVADADSFALDVTPTERAVIATHLAASASSALGGPAVFLTTMGPSSVAGSGVPSAPQLIGGPGAGPLGSASVAVVNGSGGQGRTVLGYSSGSSLRAFGISETGTVAAISPAATPPTPGGDVVAAADPDGGGFLAYPSSDAEGLPVLAVQQEADSGAIQTGLVAGVRSGPIAELSLARSGLGDGLIAFRQGEPGAFEIVATRVTASPSTFQAKAPSGWVSPGAALLRWGAAESSSGGVTYTVLIDGRQVAGGLHRLSFKPGRALTGSGVLSARVLATDSAGDEELSKPVKLRVDSRPPVAHVALDQRSRRLTVKLKDAESGLRRAATRIDFGDGADDHGGAKLRHVYAKPGSYELSIRARDRVGNVLTERLRVRVR
jgi:hypothetical protein